MIPAVAAIALYPVINLVYRRQVIRMDSVQPPAHRRPAGCFRITEHIDRTIAPFYPVGAMRPVPDHIVGGVRCERSEEHTSELQSLMRISYAVFCLKKKTN